MAGDITYVSVARLAAAGVAQLVLRTRHGDLSWRQTTATPVARFTAEDDGIRYTLTVGRDGLPTILTAFDTAQQLLLWKTSSTPSLPADLQALEQLVTTRFTPANAATTPTRSRVILFPLRPVLAATTASLAERSAS